MYYTVKNTIKETVRRYRMESKRIEMVMPYYKSYNILHINNSEDSGNFKSRNESF